MKLTVSRVAVKIHEMLSELAPEERERVFDAVDIINELRVANGEAAPRRRGRKPKAAVAASAGETTPNVAPGPGVKLKKDGTPRKKPGRRPKAEAETGGAPEVAETAAETPSPEASEAAQTEVEPGPEFEEMFPTEEVSS